MAAETESSYRDRVKVIDESRVAPPPGSVSTATISLTFFDMLWPLCPPVSRIFVYESPNITTPHFTQNIYPHLKRSLSLTLRHFFPFAANLIVPCPADDHHRLPCVQYNEGDSVSFTVAESDAAHFKQLTADHARDNRAFQSLFPRIPATSLSPETRVDVALPTMAVQVTVFPNSGISIGIAFNHVVADGRSFRNFMKSWAFIHRQSSGGRGGGGELEASEQLPLPCHSKELISDPDGLCSFFWKSWREFAKDMETPRNFVPRDQVRLSLVMNRAQIEKLKGSVASQIETGTMRVTTFVVTCAFMWVNLIKIQHESDETSGSNSNDDDALYHFGFLADCRERADLSIPAAYFGNCLAQVYASAKGSELLGGDGIAAASKAIGGAIGELEKGPLAGAKKWPSEFVDKVKQPGRVTTIAGSPRFRVYDTDFGWGKPSKSEVGHIGGLGAFSLQQSRDEEGVEIGVVLDRDKLDLFNALIHH